MFFPDRAGNLNEIYPSYNWLSGAQLTRLENMCDKYVNSIWFSGHSHWKWEMQSFQDRANIYRNYKTDGTPTCGWCVHVPSCAEPRITTTGSDRVDQPLESQGAVVDVYENYVDIRGVDLKTNLYLPIATYRLDTTIFEIVNNEEETPTSSIYLTNVNFAKSNQTYINNGVDINGSETECPTTSWDESTSTLSITFDNHSQKLICHTDALTTSTVSGDISITAESVQYFIGNTEITNDSRYTALLNGIGFYLEDGLYSATVPSSNGSYVSYNITENDATQNNGCNLQFNISKSKYYTLGTESGLGNADLFPITIKMVKPMLTVSGSDTGDSELPDGAIAIKASNFYLSGSNEGNPTVEDDGEDLVLTFDAIKNRFMYTTPEINDGVNSVTLYHSGVEYSSTLNDTNKTKIGFQITYDVNGTWETTYGFESGSTLNCTVDDSQSGRTGYKVECNTSSSYGGTLPITVRLKKPYLIVT